MSSALAEDRRVLTGAIKRLEDNGNSPKHAVKRSRGSTAVLAFQPLSAIDSANRGSG